MALIIDEYCLVCKTQTIHINNNCAFCMEKKRKEYIRMWEAQDIETKLTDLRKRIEILERSPMIY